jgi:hypothetical protein
MTLANVPTEAWIGLVGVCVGALLSVLGVWLSNRATLKHLKIQLQHERDLKAENLLRERFEELYVLVEHWLNGLFGNYMSLNMVMQGKLTYNQHLDQIIENGNSSKHDFQRLEMIINIYALSIKEKYDAVMEARSKLNEISTVHKLEYEKGNIDGSIFLDAFIVAQVTIEKRGGVLLEAIASETRSS